MQSIQYTISDPNSNSDNAQQSLYRTVVQQFASDVEQHLQKHNQTCLVGDNTWTVADLIAALALAEACAATGVQLDHHQTKVLTWRTTVLEKLRALQPHHKELKQLIQSLTSTTTTAAAAASGSSTATPTAAAPVTPTAAAAATAADPTSTSTTVPGDTPETNAILKLLQEHGITYEQYDHVACQTAEELVANVPLPSEKETHTKNLFLKDKKHGFFLVTVQTSTTVNTKELGKLLGLAGKTNLRMADARVLDEVLHVTPGSVGPLGIGLAAAPNNNEPKVTLAVDQKLVDGTYQFVHSHPLRNDRSVKLTPAALQEYWTKCGVQPVVLALDETTAAAATEIMDPLTGKIPANRPPASKEKKQQQPKQPKTKATSADSKKTAKKGDTLLALQSKKQENFADWYTDVIVLSEMISYYKDVSGCYILRPWSYKMWELVQDWFNGEIQKLGVENSYFPMFVSEDRLAKEKDHVEGFAPEVAWVTRAGDTDLAKPIAIRPTSETIMYPAYSDWIKSHRDLPLKLNQWSNVVRWEFKYPTPFLRTREFLWQEGHTAHATFADADVMVRQALELYRGVYEDLLAVPVCPGYKTEKEKFAGGFQTTTVEAYIAGSGRAIQGATSHNLGQNFGKMFDIRFQDANGQSQIAWQTSWGLTTRTIGVMVMVHGDDTGLVLPPRVAPLQVVIVPILSKKLTAETADPYCRAILADLQAAGLRAKYDDREIYNPGWKYNHWEQKGVPVRIEVGPRDMEQQQARIVIRHDGAKEDHPVEGMGVMLRDKLTEIQAAMFEKAKKARDSHMVTVTEWKDFVPNLEKNNLVLTPWIGGEHQDWEEWVKTKSREESLLARGEEAEDEKTATSVAAKTLCIPFDQPELPPGTKCIASGEEATCWILWGRSY